MARADQAAAVAMMALQAVQAQTGRVGKGERVEVLTPVVAVAELVVRALMLILTITEVTVALEQISPLLGRQPGTLAVVAAGRLLGQRALVALESVAMEVNREASLAGQAL